MYGRVGGTWDRAREKKRGERERGERERICRTAGDFGCGVRAEAEIFYFSQDVCCKKCKIRAVRRMGVRGDLA